MYDLASDAGHELKFYQFHPMSLSLVKPLRLTKIKRNTFEIKLSCLKPGTNQKPQIVSKITTTLPATVEVQGVALLVLEVAILVVLTLTLVLAMD